MTEESSLLISKTFQFHIKRNTQMINIHNTEQETNRRQSVTIQNKFYHIIFLSNHL